MASVHPMTLCSLQSNVLLQVRTLFFCIISKLASNTNLLHHMYEGLGYDKELMPLDARWETAEQTKHKAYPYLWQMEYCPFFRYDFCKFHLLS
jgi:hypothetical protein